MPQKFYGVVFNKRHSFVTIYPKSGVFEPGFVNNLTKIFESRCFSVKFSDAKIVIFDVSAFTHSGLKPYIKITDVYSKRNVINVCLTTGERFYPAKSGKFGYKRAKNKQNGESGAKPIKRPLSKKPRQSFAVA